MAGPERRWRRRSTGGLGADAAAFSATHSTLTLNRMPRFNSRRPRFERAPVLGIALTSRDLETLRAVHRHRLLRSTHLLTFFGGSRQAMLRRLHLLFHHGFLDRPPMQLDWYARGSEPMVYALGNRGAKALELTDDLRRGGTRWDTKNRNVSRRFLHHTLAVAEVMVAFEAACQSHRRVEFISPEEILARVPEETRRRRLPFRWQADVRWKGRVERLGIEPDKVFGLRFEDAPDSRRHAFFLLEADRGTMPVMRKGLAQTSFFRKLLAYEATRRHRLHGSQLGIPNFRVLTVTMTKKRVANLLAACQRVAGGSGLFLFTDRESLAGVDILTHEWVNGRGEIVRLIEVAGEKPRQSGLVASQE